MEKLDRRQVLTLGSAMAIAHSASSAAVEPAAPPAPPAPPRIELPANWKRAPTIPLWPGTPPGVATFAPPPVPGELSPGLRRNIAMPELHVFRPRRPNGSAVLVIPGGAYFFVSVVNEGAAIAPRLTARGCTVFVLSYRLPGEGWVHRSDVPLQDAQRAMRLIRARAAEFRLDPARVSAIGFSAGGHLASTLATHHAERSYDAVDASDALDARPFALGLVYPVVTMREPWTHPMSRRLLLGEQPTAAEIDRRCAELHVDQQTPPVFLVHAYDDRTVPVENSLQLMDALRAAHRPFEAHLLQEGGHGFGVGKPGTPAALWIDLHCAWLERLAYAA